VYYYYIRFGRLRASSFFKEGKKQRKEALKALKAPKQM